MSLISITKLDSRLVSGLVAALITVCGLGAATSNAWALNAPSEDQRGLQLTLNGAPTINALDDSTHTAADGPLQLSFGKPGSLKVEAFTFLGRESQRGFGGLSGRNGFGLSGIAPSWASAGKAERSQQDQASYYQAAYTAGTMQLQAKLLDVGARFSASGASLKQMDPSDAKTVQEAVGTRNLDLNALWKLSQIASFTSKYNTASNDKPGDKNRGLSTRDTTHTFAFALSPASNLQASMNEHDETWDPTLGKMNLQRRTSAMEFKTRLASTPGNDLRMALTTTRTKEGTSRKSESVREMHLNLAPTSRLQFAADSVTKSTGQGKDQRNDSVSTTMQLAPSARLAALVRSSSSEDGTRTRETNLKLDTTLGHGDTSGELLTEQKVIRSTDQSQSKEVLNVNLTGGVGAGDARTNIRATMLQDRALGMSRRMSRTTTLHAGRALGRRVKLIADREEKLAGSDQQVIARIKSAYQIMAELSSRSGVAMQLNSEKGGDQPDRIARNLTFEHQAAAYRFRAAQQIWRDGAAKRSATNCAVDVPNGRIADWAKEITHGHQFADAPEYMMPKEPNWLDMPFSGFRVYSKRFRGGPDSGVRSVGWAHRTMIADRLHVQVACQGRPEAEDGDAKGRPMAVRRKLVEIGTLVGGRLVAQTRFTGDESIAGPAMKRHDIGFGLRGPLSKQEQLEAMFSREVSDGTDKAKGRTSVTLMYALKAGDDHEVSVKTGYAWTTDSVGTQKVEYRWSLGYSKPI